MLAGCSPKVVGLIGIAKDPQGNLVAVTDGCGEVLDYARLTATRDGGPTATAANGQLQYDRSELGRFELPGGPQATRLGPTAEFTAGFTYSVGAWNDSQSVGAGIISFRVDELTRLPVDRVYRGESGNGGPSGRTTPLLTVSEWLAATCEDKR